MKQQTRKPPKPHQSHTSTPAIQSHTPNIGQQPRSSKNNNGKENAADQNRNATHSRLQLSKTDSSQASNQKQRFKSNGANRSSLQQTQRPQTACQQSKMPSPHSDLKPQKGIMHSTMNNTAKLNQHSILMDDHQQTEQPQTKSKTVMYAQDQQPVVSSQQQPKSKYSSTRQKLQQQEQQASQITAKKIMQPKLIVQGELDGSVLGGQRLSPSRAAAQLMSQGKDHLKRKSAKKSKSQTIQAASSQNLKSSSHRGYKQRRFMDFLDTSIIPNQQSKDGIEDEKELTLKILNHSANDISQSKAAKRLNSSDRNKVQMKYLNFQRKNVQNKAEKSKASNKRSATTINQKQQQTGRNDRSNLNKTQSTSADRMHGLTGSYSPRSKTGSAISRHVFAQDVMAMKEKSNRKAREAHLLTKSAVDIPVGISTILLDRAIHNDSDLSMAAAFKKQQNNSALNGPNDQSHLMLMPPKNQRSGPDVKKHKSSISPDRASKIDKIIRDNIKKELQAQESRRRELKEREASSQRRKNLLEQKNQSIRKLNNEKMQRRRMKLKENMTIWGEERDHSETKLLEEALLAVSDGAQQENQFDSRISNKANSRTLQLQQKKELQNRIQKFTNEVPQQINLPHNRTTQGMDFINVRKEILSELKAQGGNQGRASKLNKKDWIESTLVLETSKSQKQDFLPLRTNVHATSLSLNQPHLIATGSMPDHKKTHNLATIKNENMLGKRDKIRKFMKEKAKLLQTQEQQQKANTVNTVKKVRCNLTKLNEFVQSKMHTSSGITTPALRVKRSNNNTAKNQDHKKVQQDRNITPSRHIGGIFEHSDVSLNISAKRTTNKLNGQQTQKEFQKMHDTLYEDSRLSSIDAQDERSAKRSGGNQAKVLSVCFEKSASQKALRKQLRASHSPQILKTSHNKQQTSSNNQQRPRSALSLQGSQKSQPKRKIKTASSSKRPKSGGPTSGTGQKKFILPAQGKLSFKQTKTPPVESRSEDAADEGLTLNLRFTEKAAATVIQKEVRKYLANLGFYEARLKGSDQQSPRLYSPDQHIINGQIDLFIKPRSVSSKKSSPILHRNSTGRKSKSKSPGTRHRKSQSSQEQQQYELIDHSRGGLSSSVKIEISPEQLRNIQLFQDSQMSHQKSSMADQEDDDPHKDYNLSSHHKPENIRQYPKEPKRNINLISKPLPKQVPQLWGNSQTPLSLHQEPSPHAQDVMSQTSSLFDRNSFQQQFSQQRLANLMKNNEYQQLIQFREECLMYREQQELRTIKKLYKEKQLTPRTYKNRQQQIEKWVTLQRQEIEQTKLGFKEEWDKTVQMIEDTQKNVDLTKLKLHGVDSNSYSQASSTRQVTKPPRSILIDEAPKSYRSGRHEPHQIKISDVDPSQGMLTGRDSQKIDDMINMQLDKEQQNLLNDPACNSEIKSTNQGSQNLDLKQQQSLTGEKIKTQNLVDSHLRSSSGEDIDVQPSVAFINRLEKANHLPFQQSPGNQTLTLEGQSLQDGDIDHLQPNDTDGFGDSSNFKNNLVQMQDLKKLLAGESQGTSDQLSDHKSEPLMGSGSNTANINKEDLKISDMLKNRSDLKQILNYQEDENEEGLPAESLIPAVPKKEDEPAVVTKSEEDRTNQLHNKMADTITEELMRQLVADCVAVPKRQKMKTPPPVLPDADVYSVVDQFSIEKEEKKEWIEIRQRHLIEANLIRADQYVNELVDVLLQFDISDISENSEFDYDIKPNDNFHIQFLKLLTQPILRPPIDSLQLMQKSELGSYQHFETTLDASKHPIVSVDLYLDIEKAREDSMQQRKSTADAKKLQIWESIHIFNKCIFDAVNESLMKFRPYGIVGQPMPWSNKVRRLQTKVEIASVDTERLFQMVKQEIFRWSQVFCGCLPGPVFYFPSPQTGKDQFEEGIFQEVRERRLTAILTQDQVEQEHHWLNYEFEETQVKVDLSDMILETLVGELVGLLQNQNQE